MDKKNNFYNNRQQMAVIDEKAIIEIDLLFAFGLKNFSENIKHECKRF